MKRMTLKPNLVFNSVCCLGVILNGKFRSFLVRILIEKDNTDNKVFKKEFHTKKTRKKGVEKIETSVWQTKFFEFEYLFLFSFLKMFQFSFNFDSSERLFFQQCLRVEFIFQLILIDSF